MREIHISTQKLIETVAENKSFEIEIKETNRYGKRPLSNDEELAGPFDIKGTDLRLLLKTTVYRGIREMKQNGEQRWDIQFILLDCEGDLIHFPQGEHNYGLDAPNDLILNLDPIRMY